MPFDKAGFQERFSVSRETIAGLEAYEALLQKWNPRINLVSRTTLAEVWHRHFADSAQLWELMPETASNWLDFGSGAGFPALVIATLAKEKKPDLRVVLVESDQRKCAFLINVIAELGLNAEVKAARIEDIPSQNADVISARAVAPLERLLELSALHAHKSTVMLFPKGNSYESELTAARKHWHIEQKAIPSLTDPNSVILKIKEFKRAE